MFLYLFMLLILESSQSTLGYMQSRAMRPGGYILLRFKALMRSGIPCVFTPTWSLSFPVYELSFQFLEVNIIQY